MEGFARYYDEFFPYRTWFQWLNHSPVPSQDFTRREFAFTINNGSDDIYLRYQSFTDAVAFKNKTMSLVPKRFEIGSVYSVPPKEHKRYESDKFKALAKELVFDIDLSDYDAFRTCCSGKQVCMRCWQYVTVAIEVMSATFTEDFGYENVLWAFSGRRGVHAWICDERARKLDDLQRSEMVDYLNVTKQNLARPFHPMVKRSLDICTRRFDQIVLADQDPWQDQAATAALLKRLEPAGSELLSLLSQKWRSSSSSSREKWRDIDSVAQQIPAKKVNANALLEAKEDIILEYLYPKLDLNVSRSRKHLLKSPFCVHPDTGKVCVPISMDSYKKFNPDEAPTLQQLLAEKDSNEADGKGALEPYLVQFRQFVQALNRTGKRKAGDTLEF